MERNWSFFISFLVLYFISISDGLPATTIVVVDDKNETIKYVNTTGKGETFFDMGRLTTAIDCNDYCCSTNTYVQEYGTIYSHGTKEFLYDSYYQSHIDCVITLLSFSGKRIQLFTKDGANLGYGDYLYIYDGYVNSHQLTYAAYWHNPKEINVVSSSNIITMRFKTNGVNENTGFALYFSHFEQGLFDCPDDTFECKQTGRCISDYLECDGHYACSDFSDEHLCLGTAAIVGVVIGSIIAIVCAICCCVYCRWRHNKKRAARLTSTVAPMYNMTQQTMPMQPLISPAVSPMPMANQIQQVPQVSYAQNDLHPSQIPAPANYMTPN